MPDICVVGSPALPQRFQRTRLLSGSAGGGLPAGTRLASAKSATTGAWTPVWGVPIKSAQTSQPSHRATSGTCEANCISHRRCLHSIEGTGSLLSQLVWLPEQFSCLNAMLRMIRTHRQDRAGWGLLTLCRHHASFSHELSTPLALGEPWLEPRKQLVHTLRIRLQCVTCQRKALESR